MSKLWVKLLDVTRLKCDHDFVEATSLKVEIFVRDTLSKLQIAATEEAVSRVVRNVAYASSYCDIKVCLKCRAQQVTCGGNDITRKVGEYIEEKRVSDRRKAAAMKIYEEEHGK